jgi:hypothetical protein
VRNGSTKTKTPQTTTANAIIPWRFPTPRVGEIFDCYFGLTFAGLKYIINLATCKRGWKVAAKKMGRPTDNPKDITMKIRFDKDTSEMLEKCSEHMGVSRAEVVRRGVRKLYDDLKK